MATHTFTKIECGECGGSYIAYATLRYRCEQCDRTVTDRDIVLDEGETLSVRDGVLGYLSEEHCGHDSCHQRRTCVYL